MSPDAVDKEGTADWHLCQPCGRMLYDRGGQELAIGENLLDAGDREAACGRDLPDCAAIFPGLADQAIPSSAKVAVASQLSKWLIHAQISGSSILPPVKYTSPKSPRIRAMIGEVRRCSREARQAAGMTLEQMAEATGLSVATLSNFETAAKETRDIDGMVAIYERECGLPENELWRRAAKLRDLGNSG